MLLASHLELTTDSSPSMNTLLMWSPKVWQEIVSRSEKCSTAEGTIENVSSEEAYEECMRTFKRRSDGEVAAIETAIDAIETSAMNATPNPLFS